MRVTDKYVFFMKGILGNWARTPMTYEGRTFFSSEQLFMYLKAVYFEDKETAELIAHAKTSAEAKDLGRLVKNFDEDMWVDAREYIMHRALVQKYKFSEEFRNVLKENRGKIFVECNPVDHIWAIGKAEDDPSIDDMKNWDGLNLLGYVLTNLAEHALYYDSLL